MMTMMAMLWLRRRIPAIQGVNMSLDKNGRISSSDQKVDKAKYDACPLWETLKRRKDELETRPDGQAQPRTPAA